MSKRKKGIGTKFFTPDDWFVWVSSLNKEIPVEQCGLELTEEDIKHYNEELEWLKNERAENPGMPIAYEVRYRDFD